MGFGNNWNWGSKGSNFNFQKRLLQMYQECCGVPPPIVVPPPLVTGTLYYYDFGPFINSGIFMQIDAGVFGLLDWSYGNGTLGPALQALFTAGGETYSNTQVSGANGAWILTTEDVSGWTWIDVNNPGAPQPFIWNVLEVNPQLKCYKGSQNPVSSVSTIYFKVATTPVTALNMDVNNFGSSTAPFDSPGYDLIVQGGLQFGYGTAVTYEQVIVGDSISFVINNIYMPLTGLTTNSGSYSVSTVPVCPAIP